MFTVQEYILPKSIQEAYEALIKRKNNVILGGCAWLRMGNKRIGTAIDLNDLNLNFIEESEEGIEIGAMTTFREIEISSLLLNNFNGILPKSIENIIGVQFRNTVTLGGTVYSKYGFSDLITALLSLETDVVLYDAGRMSLEEFLQQPYKRDILIKIVIKKEPRRASYNMMRNSASDYALLNVSVSECDGKWKVVIGARPAAARIAKKASEFLTHNTLDDVNIEKAAVMACEELSFGSNMRSSKEYREILAEILVKRAITEVMSCK